MASTASPTASRTSRPAAFFLDWGLKLVREARNALDFREPERLRACIVADRRRSVAAAGVEAGSTLREVIWGVIAKPTSRRCGRVPAVRPERHRSPLPHVAQARVASRARRPMSGAMRAAHRHAEPGLRARRAGRGRPCRVLHRLLDETDEVLCSSASASSLRPLSRPRPFLRCAARGGHHDLFLLQLPDGKRGLNHVAFTVRDIHEVFGGGLAISRCGWTTQIGPGRHPVSSACSGTSSARPAAGRVLRGRGRAHGSWQPRDFDAEPRTMFAEWAVDGGIDGNTHRQAGGPQGG